MKFCKCGNELKEGAQFCESCGAPVEEVRQDDLIDHHSIGPPKLNSLKISVDKKTKLSLIAAAIAAVVLFGGYLASKALTSKDLLIDKLQTALTNHDAKTVASLLSTNNSKAKIDENSVKGLMKYFGDNPNQIKELIQHLKSESKMYDDSGSSTIQTAGSMSDTDQGMIDLKKDKRFLFFDKYRLNVKTFYLHLSTNHKDTIFFVDGQKVGKSDRSDFNKNYGPFLPGTHQVQAELKTIYGDLKAKHDLNLIDADQPVDISMPWDNVDVMFGLDGAPNITGELFINGIDVGTDPFKNSSFSPVVRDGSLKVSVEADAPWGMIKTNSVPINDLNATVNLVDDGLKNTFMSSMESFYKVETNAINTGDLSTLTMASDHLKSQMKKEADQLAAANEVYTFTYNTLYIDLDSFKLNFNNGIWTVTGNIGAVFHDDQTTDPNLKVGTDFYQTEMDYDPMKKVWLVNDFQEAVTTFDTANMSKVKEIDLTSGTNDNTAATQDPIQADGVGQLVQDFNSNVGKANGVTMGAPKFDFENQIGDSFDVFLSDGNDVGIEVDKNTKKVLGLLMVSPASNNQQYEEFYKDTGVLIQYMDRTIKQNDQTTILAKLGHGKPMNQINDKLDTATLQLNAYFDGLTSKLYFDAFYKN